MTAKRSQIMSIIKAYSGQANTIAIPRVYIELTGDFNRAAILNQILYWAERTTDKNGWFYKTYDQWEDELGLSKYQVKRAIEGDKRNKDNSQSLTNIGIETTVRKAPNGAPTVHYRVNEDVFIKHLTTAIGSLNEKQNPKVNNVNNQKVNNVENEQSTMSTMESKQSSLSLYTETTTETTTKDSVPEPQAVPVVEEAKQGDESISDSQSDKPKTQDLSKHIALLETITVVTPHYLGLLKEDALLYSFEEWQAAVVIVKDRMREQSIKTPYKYLLGVLKSRAIEAKNAPPPVVVPYHRPFVSPDVDISEEDRKKAFEIFTSGKPDFDSIKPPKAG